MEFKLNFERSLGLKNFLLKTMRLLLIFFSSAIFALAPNKTLSQSAKIKITEDKLLSVDEAFNLIKDQTDYSFAYQSGLFKNVSGVWVSKGIISASELLSKCLKQGNFEFVIAENNVITIINSNEEKPQAQVTGKVTDGNGNPLPGVTILVEGTSRGSTTGFDGDYAITANTGDVLVFSFLGFSTEKREVAEGTKLINVTLKEAVSVIDEVVVIGYGKAKRDEISGAVSTVSGKDIEKSVQPSVEGILGGTVSGVNVTRTSGEPGSGASIQIRGFSSFSGSNEPLYVIDGVPFQPNPSDSQEGINPLGFLNPADIASISVLKDASSTAIYGSRAANGVVIITTKRGQPNEKINFTVDFNSSFQAPIQNIKFLNKEQFFQVVEQAFDNSGVPFDRATIDLGGDVNWIDEATRLAVMNTLNVSANGGSKDGNTQYSASLNFVDQEGVVNPGWFKRYGARMSLDTQVTDKFKMGISLNYVHSNRGPSPLYNSIAISRPDLPRFYSDYTDTFNSNLLYQTESIKTDNPTDMLLGNIYGEYEIFKHLKVRSSFSLNRLTSNSFRFTPRDFANSIDDEGNPLSRRSESSYSSDNYVWDNTLTYDNSFSGDHHLNALIGASWNLEVYKNMSILSQGFPNDDFLFNLGSANSISSYSSGKDRSGLASYFSRVSYDYKNTYFITASARADRSTKFGPKNQWGYFPSIGGAWDITKNLIDSKAINQLKLKASYGVTGLASFDFFEYITLYETGAFYNQENGYTPLGIPNEDIRWEKTTQFDVGLDFRLLNNRLSGSLGYYSKYTNDVLMRVPIPLEPGGGDIQTRNIGEINNTGIEFELNANIINTDDLKWNLAFNITKQSNTVEKLENGFIDDFGFVYLEEGKPLGDFLGYRSKGLIQTQAEIDALNAAAPDGVYMFDNSAPGDVLIEDLDGDGTITSEDREVIGNAIPKFYGGLNSIFNYKNFEVSAYFQYQLDRDLIPTVISFYSKGFSDAQDLNNLSINALDAWTPTNTNTLQPRHTLGQRGYNASDTNLLVSDASFLRLKTLRLAYNFNNIKSLNGMNITLYATASDLFTITSYKGENPETSQLGLPSDRLPYFGQDSLIYPYSRTFTLGLNFKF